MTAAPSARVDKTIEDVARRLHHEAVSGPARSGIADTVRLGPVTIDAAASRGWGVHLSRALPGGETLTRDLTGAGITVAAVEAALTELVAHR